MFGEEKEEIEIVETFFKTAPTLKKLSKKNLEIDQAVVDLKTVVETYNNDNYVPPSSLPKMPPLLFHTFKRSNATNVSKNKDKLAETINSNFDAIEIAPDQNDLPV